MCQRWAHGSRRCTRPRRTAVPGSHESIAIVVPLAEGRSEVVREFLAEGPPFDPTGIGLESHKVFLTDREAIFVFDTVEGAQAFERILAEPEFWDVVVGLGAQRLRRAAHRLGGLRVARIAVVGTGRMGVALGRQLAAAGHSVRLGSRDPAPRARHRRGDRGVLRRQLLARLCTRPTRSCSPYRGGPSPRRSTCSATSTT